MFLYLTHCLDLILLLGIKSHANADDSQIHIFTQDLLPESQTCISNCLFNSSNQMHNCYVKFKMFKTEVLISTLTTPSTSFLNLVNEIPFFQFLKPNTLSSFWLLFSSDLLVNMWQQVLSSEGWEGEEGPTSLYKYSHHYPFLATNVTSLNAKLVGDV